jgi:hypothetical protein
MMITPTRRKFFLCFWATSIVWMYVGLLVNFHQHKIWGKELIPQFVFYKRGVDKPFKSWDLSKKARDNSGESFDHFDFTFIQAGDATVLQYASLSSLLPCVTSPLITPHPYSSVGLRAPPIA